MHIVANNMKPNQNIETYKEFVRPYYSTRDAGHDFRHIERIISRLDVLCEGLPEQPDKIRLYFLASFHGLWPRWRDDADFRTAATAFLQSLGWTDQEIEDGFASIERHLPNPQTLEEQIVHDANYIELLGAFGVAKTFTVGGARGQTYEETIGHFERNLARVEFRTPAGQRLAEEGREYGRAFVERLKREW